MEDAFDTLLELALREDLGLGLGASGDVTSGAIFSAERATARLYSKDTGILAGSEFAARVYAKVDPSVRVRFAKEEGAALSQGELVAEVEGPVKSILEGERVMINFLAFLSGIATLTRGFVAVCEEANAAKAPGVPRTAILDTRKTLPGYRALSKYAVRVGGGSNHRQGLYDMVLIKDNHIDAAGGIPQAVERARARWGNRFRIEVETRSLDEVSQALDSGVDVIMLDNMDMDTCAQALALRRGGVKFEASGNFTLERVAQYARLGVDYISVGSNLTLSVRVFDFSLRME
jgi:nicotinate-nucleotide pyrophosphorylase (carboxylating)